MVITMINMKETEEREFLNKVLKKLRNNLREAELRIEHYSKEILKTKQYMYENAQQLDGAEKAANRIAVNDDIAFGEEAKLKKKRLEKLIKSPYFGRMDFIKKMDKGEMVCYIGIHGVHDTFDREAVIYDWRAPISSMFYDHETGPAFYLAPDGKLEGTIKLKRQYHIRNSNMEYMIESAINIDDDVLRKELSRNTDDKMKNIVATIQKEQNQVIRNETAKVLIIQGSAGSGKTSVALHRVAFLLYRYKEKLSSDNVLILSPNKVFGNYISNVLPELGEENMLEMGFEDLARELLDKNYSFQSFFSQVESLLEDSNKDIIERIEFKATNEFVAHLNAYLEMAEKEYFIPEDIILSDYMVTKEKLLISYNNLKNMSVKARLNKIYDDIIQKYKSSAEAKAEQKTLKHIRKSILDMFKYRDSLSLYEGFYSYINRSELFNYPGKNEIEYCDVFPLLYVTLFFEGCKKDYKEIKHLMVDEMQDYTPIQYAVLAKLFSCKMTILGDSHQKVNPYSSSSMSKISPYFNSCQCITLCKSYRSTIEITNFAQKIQKNEELIPIERHGELPGIIGCNDEREELDKIKELINGYKKSPYTSLGIICKSQKQAAILCNNLTSIFKDVVLLDFRSTEFKEGIIITSSHLAKGLEFDQVIIPYVSDAEYKTTLDKSLLYIACTRAMHKLNITYQNRKSDFITD